MNYLNLESHFSTPRLQRYLTACASCNLRASELYRANLNVSKSFYPILNLFEVALRNAVYNNLSTHFSDPDWIVNEMTGFMSDHSLRGRRPGQHFVMRQKVNTSQINLRRKGLAPTSTRIIAELHFGFWVSLFKTKHYRLIRGSVIHCFPYKPRHINRTALYNKLDNIRRFRNRIYHNEPICFANNNIDFNLSRNVRRDIRDLAGWVDPQLLLYLDSFDDIDTQITLAMRI